MCFCHGNIPLGWGLFWQALLLNGRHIQLDTRRAMTKIRYTLQIGIGEYIDLLDQCCNFYWQPRCAYDYEPYSLCAAGIYHCMAPILSMGLDGPVLIKPLLPVRLGIVTTF